MLYTRLKPIWNNVRKGTLLASILSLGLLSIVGSGGGGGDGPTPVDKPGTLQFSSATYSVTEGTATVTITVTRTGGDDGAVSVDYATADGTANSGDYTAIPATTLNWADGDAADKTFTVTILDDGIQESSEDFTVSLSNVVTATLGTPNTATVTITDDDNPGALQLSSATYSATEGVPTVSITVIRSGGSAGAVSVDYATADNTATAGTDYTAINATTLNWADGDAADKTFTVTILDDGIPESSEDFTVSLSNVVTATLGTPSTATVTITDDDNPGTVQFSSATYSASEGVPTVTITVTRSGGSIGAASVDYATADDTAEAGTDYTAISATTLNWADGDAADKTFTVTILDDSDLELTQAFNVVLSNATGATLGSPATASVSITDNEGITINGTVSAPFGQLAYKQPSLLQRMFASLFGKSANAAVSDYVMPVASVDVTVYSIDDFGNTTLTAPTITTTTDGNGDYTLLVPNAYVDSGYIVRAEGQTGETMDARIVGATVDIDPATDATSDMVVLVDSNVINISTKEIIEMHEDIAEFITDIDTSGLTATIMSDRLHNMVASRVGELNVMRSKDHAGQICGNVKSAGAANLEDIRIIVRDYNTWQARARTNTDANGDYCLNVPYETETNPDGGTFSGEYIVGAINRTDDSMDPERSASEWYSNSGNAYTQHEANKISVTLASPLVNNIDFTLAAGARITGTVRANTSLAALEGVQVDVRDYDTNRLLAIARVESNGSYSVNVIPGQYRIAARNWTTAAYASEYYDGSTGTNNRNLSTRVTGNPGDEVTVDFVLEDGSLLDGTVTDGGPVMDTTVKIDIADSSVSETKDTDRNGYYNVWLRPDNYDVYVHGQQNLSLSLASSTTANFSATVSSISGQLQDSGGNPVARAAVRLFHWDTLTDTTTVRDLEASDGNGDFTVYTDEAGPYLIEARNTDDLTVGSIIYANHTRLLSGNVTTISTPLGGGTTLPGPVVMPSSAGMLSGHVYNEAFGSGTLTGYGNFRIQLRDDDDLTTVTTGTGLVDRFLQTRTNGDGSYAVALPAGQYDRVQMRDASFAGSCGYVIITAGATTELNFYDGGGGYCEFQ